MLYEYFRLQLNTFACQGRIGPNSFTPPSRDLVATFVVAHSGVSYRASESEIF
jgi:hypothetical protein